MKRFTLFRDIVFIAAALATVIGGTLAGGLWLGHYVTEIQESRRDACETKWISSGVHLDQQPAMVA